MLFIANEVDLLIFQLRMFCMRYKLCFSNNWYQSGLQFRICIKCFVSFGIRDSNFMLLEDYTFNFLHGCWNYLLMKTDIDVMMLFKFDIKYVKLNFKSIASMEFSFDINLCLLCSFDGCLFMKNHWKLLQKNSGKFKFHEFHWSKITFNQSSETVTNLFDSIDIRLLVDQSNVLFRSIEQRSSTNQARQIVKYEFLIFSTDQDTHSIDWKLWILNFSKCFQIDKVQGYV